MVDNKNLLLHNKKTNDLQPYQPRVSRIAVRVIGVCFLSLIGFLISIAVFSSSAIEVEKIDLPIIPNIKIEVTVIILVGIGMIVAYLRNPYTYKSCPYQSVMYLMYFPIILGIIFFVRYCRMLGLLLVNIPELDYGWSTQLTIYYGEGDNVLFSILAWHEFLWLLIGLIGLGTTMYVFVDFYKSFSGMCKAWKDGEKTQTQKWEKDGHRIPLECKTYKKNVEICKQKFPKTKNS